MSLRERLKNNKNIILFFAIVIFFVSLDIIIVGLFNAELLFQNIFSFVTIGDRILFITFWALLWYARETQKIREIEEKPIVDLYYRPKTSNHERYFRLRNNGKGVAYNVQVETVRFNNKIFEFYFKDPNLILTSGDKQTFLVDAKYEYNQFEELESNPLSRFLGNITEKSVANKDKNNPDLLRDKQKTKIVVTYENALNKKFKRIFYIYYKPIMANLAKDYEIEFYKEKQL